MANTSPDYPTMVAGRTRDGRLVGIDNSVWLYRKVPLAPVTEAKTTDHALRAAQPIVNAYEELAAMTNVRANRRGLARSAYRDTHLLLVNIPTQFRPAEGPIGGYLAEQFPNTITYSRLLLFGVKLDSSIGTGGFRAAIDSVTETLVSGGTPMSDYDRDYNAVSGALSRAGLTEMTKKDFKLANSWWNRGEFPDTPTLFHADHLHVFSSAEAVALAQQLGADNCDQWPPLAGTSAISFTSVQDIDLPYVNAGERSAQWIADYVTADAAIISIRGLVEPAVVTRGELRRNRKQNMDDQQERYREQKMDKAELEEKIENLANVENAYASGGPATLVDTSVLMAFDGKLDDVSELSGMQVTMNSMLYRQKSAWAESMLASKVRANPNRHDLPDTAVAYSGLPSLSTVGDREGAIVGFTERDRQPALLSPTAIAKEDSTPICVVAAASGAGKSMMMLWLADQFARMGRPVVIIDPKALSLDTPIPTPSGWRKNGDLRVGDQVFDRHGRPTTITALSPLFEQSDLYEVKFDDGQIIKADGQHRWVVTDAKGRRRIREGRGGMDSQLRDLTTAQLIEEGVKTTTGQSKFSVPLAGAVQYPEKELLVDPYLLGAWLGDGTSKAGQIVSGFGDANFFEAQYRAIWPALTRTDTHLAEFYFGRDEALCPRGHDSERRRYSGDDRDRLVRPDCSREQNKVYRGVATRSPVTNHALITQLRELNVLSNKHIPVDYRTASVEQRLALVQGLMDTDGTVKTRGDARISLTNEALARDLLEVVRSLGIKATIWEGNATISEPDPNSAGEKRVRVVGRQWVVTFRTEKPVFRLPRKLERLAGTTTPRSSQHYIVSITPIASEPARCIRVAEEDHTYLAGGYIPTHNTGSDHSGATALSGGQTASLDDFISADGVLDPLRFAITRQDGVEMAASMILSVNPFGNERANMEVPLIAALNYGVGHGATCIGQALGIAVQSNPSNVAWRQLFQSIVELAQASSQFRAMVGFNPSTQALRIHDGITLIKVGNSHLNLPSPGTPHERLDIPQRVSLALVRMMIFGASTALTGRDGIIMQDEAWTILNSDPKEVERLGRLARSQRVLPILFSQDISGAQRAGLAGFISRGFVGPISDPVEAKAALDLFNIEATDDRMKRITSPATMDSYGRDDNAAPNWNSMKALRDPATRRVLRGSVWMYSDLAGRVIPVECTIPEEFLRLASTNAIDMDARKAAAGQAA
ncbi:ATP-binding protein [Curtobacterium sp. MCBD17_040]|uniref:ATP-binding protein n=1 Tax=Curtobacterium sp. MCBD17_040 TaxID=2175674 RepID=UPI000DA6E29B|nr:ATP-binding protein [Curtobacterium sp. MCBD17_040]WIB65553.1 ATP-binding protein [Curtobacterium sp. MCBD17_040]